jgi:predicted dehydrogenase
MNRRHFVTTTISAAVAASSVADEPATFKVVVIGHTSRGNYGHGIDTMWLKVPETALVAVADAEVKGLAVELKKLKIEKGYLDYHQMLAETKPDIVAVGPRHVDQHRDMVLAAIQTGARGIYVEKPFCRSLKEADEIVAACERKNVKLAIAHRNRYNPVLPVIQGLLTDGAIGRVLEMRARGKEDARGGSLDLWVLGCHLFNLINYFGGKPVACSAVVLQNGKPVTKADVKEGDEGIGPLAGNEVHARFEMETGVPAFFDSIHDAGTKQAGFGLQIIGTKGIIDLRIDEDPLAHLLYGSPFYPDLDPRAWLPISTAGVGVKEPQAGIGKLVMEHVVGAQDLVAAMRQNRLPLCNMHDGRTTVEMISAVFESHRLNGQRVTFPLKTRENPLTLM